MENSRSASDSSITEIKFGFGKKAVRSLLSASLALGTSVGIAGLNPKVAVAEPEQDEPEIQEGEGIQIDLPPEAEEEEAVASDPAVDEEDAPEQAEEAAQPAPEAELSEEEAAESEEAEEEESPFPDSGSFASSVHSVDMDTAKFIAVIGGQVRRATQGTGVYGSIVAAHAILQSDSGNSEIIKCGSNNIFNVPGDFAGNYVELSNYSEAVVKSASEGEDIPDYVFAAYPSVHACIDQFVASTQALMAANLPAGQTMRNAYAVEDACQAYAQLMEGQFGENYGDKLIQTIEENDLTRFDMRNAYEQDRTYLMGTLDAATGQIAVDESGNPILEERTTADLVGEATKWLGVPYLWGGTSPAGFDCSGLVQYSYRHGMGIDISRTSQTQWKDGEPVSFNDLHEGDLLFFVNDQNDCHHVAMYLADGYYIEAPHSGAVVKITAMADKMPTFACRIVRTHAVDNSQVAESDIMLSEEQKQHKAELSWVESMATKMVASNYGVAATLQNRTVPAPYISQISTQRSTEKVSNPQLESIKKLSKKGSKKKGNSPFASVREDLLESLGVRF